MLVSTTPMSPTDPGPSSPRLQRAPSILQIDRHVPPCLDDSSEFFQVLTAPYHPPADPPALHRAQSHPDHIARCRATINWTSPGPTETTSLSHASASLQPASQLDQPIYQPHGRWAWTHGLSLDDPKQLLSLRSRHILRMFARDPHSLLEGAQCFASIDSGTVANKEIKYICRK